MIADESISALYSDVAVDLEIESRNAVHLLRGGQHTHASNSEILQDLGAHTKRAQHGALAFCFSREVGCVRCRLRGGLGGRGKPADRLGQFAWRLLLAKNDHNAVSSLCNALHCRA